jgi:D-alanine transaminase
VVRTPPLEVGILDGITRAKVLELARENRIPLEEARISPDELRAADEVFITSATRAVLPVTRLDERVVGEGVPGPVTRRLMELLAGLARRSR